MVGTSDMVLGQRARSEGAVGDRRRCSSGGNWAWKKYNPMPGVMDTAPAYKTWAASAPTSCSKTWAWRRKTPPPSSPTPLGGLARNLYAAHSLAGHGALDFSSVLKLVQGGKA